MERRFEGLTDLEWKLFEDLFPEPEQRGRGMPTAPFHFVLHTLLYVLITRCRWCDVPRGEHWTLNSIAHRWLKRWKKNGTLAEVQSRVLEIPQAKELIHWSNEAVDGSFLLLLNVEETSAQAVRFSPWQGRR